VLKDYKNFYNFMCTEILRATTLKFRVSGWLIGLVDIILKIELFD